MKRFEHDGVRLAYDVEGSGFPIVLHTGAGGDSTMWRDAGYVEGLRGHQVVLFDHRGHGESAAGEAELTVERHAADVLALADHLGFERFAFFGYSAGARVGFELAGTSQGRVAALIALGTVDGEEDDPAEWLEDARAVRAEGLGAILGDEPMPRWLRDNLMATDREVVARGLECFARWSPWPLFPRIAAPTLIVAGENEDQGCAAAAARLRDGRAVILPGLGHLAAFVRSDVVLPYVIAFLGDAV